jgi:hypothetical protein
MACVWWVAYAMQKGTGSNWGTDRIDGLMP